MFVPLPIGNGEQALNAKPSSTQAAGVLVDDGEFTPDWVRAHVPALVSDPTRLAAMGAAAAGLIRRDADDRLAELVVAVAELGRSRVGAP